jgi:transcriptional regulator with XRE-family HTH domain
MFMKDSFIHDKIRDAGMTTGQLSVLLGISTPYLSAFVSGFKSMSYKHAGAMCQILDTDLDELDKHIEMTEHEIKETGRTGVTICKYSANRRVDSWRGRELEKEREKKQHADTLERRVEYARRLGITYGDLQLRMYFDKELWGLFYGESI